MASDRAKQARRRLLRAMIALQIDQSVPRDIPGLFANGEQGWWYEIDDISTLFQDSAGTTPVTADSDPVGRVTDKSGRANHLLQATAGARPLYKTDGQRHWLESDGTQWMRAAFTIAQPWERITALRQITSEANDRIFGGVTGNAGNILQGTSPNLSLNSGAALALTDEEPLGEDFVLIERHSGASSRGAINEAAYATGNAGTTLPGGITLFGNQSLTAANVMNGRFYGGIEREGTAGLMTDAEIAAVREYMAAKVFF